MAASVMVTVPMPTPTLPEIAALFLAMLLLGSGAYLLRRRQSGGLTPRRGLAGETPRFGVWHGCSSASAADGRSPW